MKRIFTICTVAFSIAFTSCEKKEEYLTPQLRTKVSITSLDSTKYAANFKDAEGDSTVDRTIGRKYTSLFLGLGAYIRVATDSLKALSESKIKNLYVNTNDEYTGTYASLNSSGLQIKSTVASSFSTSEAEKIRTDIEGFLVKIVNASTSVADTASNGKAGRIFSTTSTSKYLVDNKGIEWGQVAQKALIGLYQMDYIGNVLLANSIADNSVIVSGTNSTQLEINWDRAYGVLTQKDIYGSAFATAPRLTSGESQLGAYAWEYNPYNPQTAKCLSDINYLFVKGRAAVVNNDKTMIVKYATDIRLTFEKALAKAALGYLAKWKNGADDAIRAHALGEGLGFIYSLRACKLSGADVAWSDEQFNKLISAGNYDLTTSTVSEVESAIKTKFGF